MLNHRSIFGWSYPPGAANDPNAPYNQPEPPELIGRILFFVPATSDIYDIASLQHCLNCHLRLQPGLWRFEVELDFSMEEEGTDLENLTYKYLEEEVLPQIREHFPALHDTIENSISVFGY